MLFDVVIVGAGPGGLACASRTAAAGLSTLVIERKKTIGQKVCAGGITWNGLIKKVPDAPWERHFPEQCLCTRFQKVRISASTPIIATVNREKLGQQMLSKALDAGAIIQQGCQVRSIGPKSVTYVHKATQKSYTTEYSHLVGADGSSSVVRRFLGIPVAEMGIGINYQITGTYPDMEWHLNSNLFKSGYAWIFPHSETVSIGAYADASVLSAKKLQHALHAWAGSTGFSLENQKLRSEYINFDFRGYNFGNSYLVGDAAGLASALTGEGIYPAIISGEAVADIICNPGCNTDSIDRLIRNHARHKKMVLIAGKNRVAATALSELVALSLKTRLLNFRSMEMA